MNGSEWGRMLALLLYKRLTISQKGPLTKIQMIILVSYSLARCFYPDIIS